MKIQGFYKLDKSKVLQFMNDKGLNNTKLAKELGMDPRNIRNWLNTGKGIQHQNVVALGMVLNVDWRELILNTSYRHNLLHNLRKKYINNILDFLQKNLPYKLELSIVQQYDFTPTPIDISISQRRKNNSWTNKTIDKAFNYLNQAILIHGSVGSGKTMMLLELFESLLKNAEDDDDSPIPVVFDLLSWSKDRESLDNWLVNELHKEYEIPKDIGLNFINNGEILPLMEGLGRVSLNHRALCIDAINLFREKQGNKYGRVTMVISCQTIRLKELNILLNLKGEVLVKPPAKVEVEKFLDVAGDGFRDYLFMEKSNVTKWKLPETPFQLAIFYDLYSVTKSDSKPIILDISNQNIISTYVNNTLSGCEIISDYVYEDTIIWLTHIAQQLKNNNTNIFFIERIQPNYLPLKLSRIATLVPIVLSGLIFGIAFGWGAQIAFDNNYGLIVGILFGLTTSPPFWMIGVGHDIQPVETFSWSWAAVRENIIDRILGALLLIPIFVLFGSILGNIQLGITVALLISISFFLFYQLPGRKVEKLKKPNEGIKKALIYSLYTGLLGALIMATSLSFIYACNIAISMGAAFGLFIGLLNGGHVCIQHLTLRSILWYKKYAPWDFVSFLNFLENNSIMYKMGGGYKFRHDLFMDYFAKLG